MPRSIEASNDADKQLYPPGLMLRIALRSVAELHVDPRNARTHGKKQIAQIAASIRRFGFLNPVLVDERGMIIAGHGRVAAAKQLGIAAVPTLRLDHMSDADRRAYAIADNRLAELAGWDKTILATELGALLDLDFEVELTGFDMAEIDILLDVAEGTTPEDIVPAPQPHAPVSRLGDLWLLGRHRLFCGSALEAASFATLMAGERADLVFSDPPYNVEINGHVSGLGRTNHREFAMASGEMSEPEFTVFLRSAFTLMADNAASGAIHFICMDWRHMGEVLDAAKGPYPELKNLVVWNKNNGGMGSLYRSKHELVFVFKSGTAPHVNTVQLGKHGRNRTNVWDYPGQNTFHRNRNQDLADHPTVKPVALVADAIRDVSRRGAVVLDPFVGSGTTVIAAEKTMRQARAIELDPIYVDVAVRRWERLTGGQARLEASGETFAAVRVARAGSADVLAFPSPQAEDKPRKAGKRPARKPATRNPKDQQGGSNEQAA